MPRVGIVQSKAHDLECGSSSYRILPSVHTAKAQGAEVERR